MEQKIGCVLMAAGEGVRFGENKLAQKLGGKTLAQRALDAVAGGGFAKTVVVTQYPEIAEAAREKGFTPVKNQHPDWGISHTISLGLAQLRDCDGVLFSVSDQPCLTAETVGRVAEAWRTSPKGIAAAAHGGTRGNPCLFDRRYFAELEALREDHGGNTVIRAHEDDLLLVETDPVELTDCDTREALEDLKRQTDENHRSPRP